MSVNNVPRSERTQTKKHRPTAVFSDVLLTDEVHNAIYYLCSQGLINGYDDGTFRPNNSMTRGQFAKILSNAIAFSGETDLQIFQDVPKSNPFYIFINRLAERGFITSYQCGEANEPCVSPNNLPYFRPYAEVTRRTLAEYVSKSAGFIDSPTDQIFEDIPPNNASYAWIERLAKRNILLGYDCGTMQEEPCKSPSNRPYFRPEQKASRGEIALVVARAFFPDQHMSHG